MQQFYYAKKIEDSSFVVMHFCAGNNVEKAKLGSFEGAIESLIDLELPGLSDDVKDELIKQIEKQKDAKPKARSLFHSQHYVGEVSKEHISMARAAASSNIERTLNRAM